MKQSKILICGATGFIGRNLTERLAQRSDLDVHAIHFSRPAYDCPGVTWHQADLRNHGDVTRVVSDTDIIIQAAATTSGSRSARERPYIHVTDNAVMNSLLLRQAFESRIKHFIFFSCTVMLPSSVTPVKETDWDANAHITPHYFPSAWTKVYIEKMCEFFSRLGAARYTVIRHSNIYGPYDKFDLERSHVFGATVTKVMTARNGRMVVWGDGEEERDLLYVGDLVKFVELAIERQMSLFELYNVGLGRSISVRDLAAKIAAASGRSIKIEYDLSQPSVKTSLSLDCTKARKELGWEPRTNIDEGIVKTISWWRKNYDGPEALP